MVVVMVMMLVMVSEASMIEQTCKETPDFNLCVSLLDSDPRGSSADTSGLALILVDKIKVFHFLFGYIFNYISILYLISYKDVFLIKINPQFSRE